jgi:hypothetical protein
MSKIRWLLAAPGMALIGAIKALLIGSLAG